MVQRRTIELGVRWAVLIPSALLCGAASSFFSDAAVVALVPVAAILFLLQSCALAVLTNPPNTKLWSPPRKLLQPIAWLVAVVASVLLLMLNRVGLFVFYGALTLLAGERVVAIIEAKRAQRAPLAVVLALGYFVLLFANALFVFSVTQSKYDGALAVAGALLVFAGQLLEQLDNTLNPPESSVPVTFVPQTFDADNDLENGLHDF